MFDAVFIHAVPPSDERLGDLTLETEPRGVALPSGSGLAKLAAISPSDLNDQAFDLVTARRRPGRSRGVLGLLVDGGMIPGPHRWSPSLATTMSLVAAGLGASFKTPHQVVPGDPPGFVWRPFVGVSLPMPTVLVWLRNGARYVAKKSYGIATVEPLVDLSNQT